MYNKTPCIWVLSMGQIDMFENDLNLIVILCISVSKKKKKNFNESTQKLEI